jgi:diguanylate cyclase (GGDEF)-like protein/hemerythrin-like metal-binding protein
MAVISTFIPLRLLLWHQEKSAITRSIYLFLMLDELAPKGVFHVKSGKGNILIVMVAWVCILGSFAYWSEIDTRREERERALTTAKAFFQQIVISRQWNALHGGVYVPLTSETQPNEYLPVQNRDLTADNGLKLTKINPAYMTRQIAELSLKNKLGIQFHVTSLMPIRPGNKATEWEERWLKSFEQGVREQGEFLDDDNITWFRYMAPLIVKTECLQCHAQQGCKEGDIRGGISVSLPYPSHDHFLRVASYGAVALVGLILIFFGGHLYARKQRLFDATFNSPIPTCVTGKDFSILIANEAYWEIFGHLPDKQKTIKCHEHRTGKSCHTECCPLTRIMNGESSYKCETLKEDNSVIKHFIVIAKPLLDARDRVLGCVESFYDITERKRIEKELEDSNRKLELLSISDGLTGIANRRRFDEMLEQEYARHSRAGAKLSLIMLDIDHFKQFNDCYGHVEGDKCLQQVAQVIAACAPRPTNLVARYGGEEFACILPETECIGAITISEKIRQAIIDRGIPHKKSKVADCVTVSLGVVTVRCIAGGMAMDVVTQADELLYQAKASGRNRVEYTRPSEAGAEPQGNFVQLIWHDSYCCGNQLIDAQHQSLFQTSNRLFGAIFSSCPTIEIAAIITRLLGDVSQHFHDEETILESVNFPGKSQHIEEHVRLLTKGLELSESFKASTLSVGDVFQFLVYEVVLQHMLQEDRRFFSFIEPTPAKPDAMKSA